MTFDTTLFDPAIKPTEDLFRHVNGRWIEETTIPEDKASWGGFAQLAEESEAACRDIITGLPAGGAQGSVEQLIGDLYASFMAEDAIEAKGAAPLHELLAKVDAVTSIPEFSTLVGWMMRHSLGHVIGFGSDADPGNPTHRVSFTDQGGLGLPDESYYRDETKAEIRAAYVDHMATMLALAGVADAQAVAQSVMDLETEIAKGHWDKVKCRDLQAMYNPMSLADYGAAAPNVHFDNIFAAAGITAKKLDVVVCSQPPFLPHLDALFTEDRLEQWKNWARWHITTSIASLLSKEFVDADFHFYSTVLMGVPVNRERWKRGVAFVQARLGEAVGKIYVERHFAPSAKERMDVLVANVLEAYRQSITALEWMSDATKQEALHKLSKFRTKIGYPKKWEEYRGMDIRPDDLVGNKLRCAAWLTDDENSKLGEPIDADEWLMTPQTVNAYYHPLRNEIVFPAGILRPPFFYPDADDAVNYGSIGAVIAHEVGHGFDDQGSTCDGDGKLRDWWTAEDREAFKTRTAVLVQQYDVLSPDGADGQTVNGEFTLGENIGDLGGLGIALKAYRIALAGTEPEPIDGYTGIQRVFLSWARAWQKKVRPEMTKQLLSVDPHSPAEFRCNQIVKNIDDFHTAFGVTEGDDMWLDPAERVTIW